jgi:hypothetical protein
MTCALLHCIRGERAVVRSHPKFMRGFNRGWARIWRIFCRLIARSSHHHHPLSVKSAAISGQEASRMGSSYFSNADTSLMTHIRSWFGWRERRRERTTSRDIVNHSRRRSRPPKWQEDGREDCAARGQLAEHLEAAKRQMLPKLAKKGALSALAVR